MASTESTMLELGTGAPDFELPDTDGKLRRLQDFAASKALLVAFICNHCPYVVRIADSLASFAREYEPKGLAMVAINANDVENYPEDSPEKMRAEVSLRGYTFPYLFDESQAVAKAYMAACTPDFFLFDADRKLVYRGQFDAARPRNQAAADGKDMRAAVDTVLAGETISGEQLASMGCNIKWKAGNEPNYYG